MTKLSALRIAAALTAAIMLSASAARAQDSHPTPCNVGSVHTYFFKNTSDTNQGNEIQTALRNVLPPVDRVYFAPGENALTLCASPDDQALAAKLLQDLDRTRKTYRLTYTFTETDAGKRVGTQHYTMIVSAGEHSTMKSGSKVPVATGSNANQTQFQYIDVGMNFDATFTETATGGLLKTKVEQSSADESKTISGVQEPLIRQMTFEGSPVLTLGKPAMLGTVDLPASTRHIEVEVMAEPIP